MLERFNQYVFRYRWLLRNKKTFYILAIVLAFIVRFLPIYLYQSLHQDVAACLYMSERILHGAKLYTDIMELNPPLIMYLGIPSVSIAEVFQISKIIVFKIYVLLFILFSLALTSYILSRILFKHTFLKYSLLFTLVLLYFPFYNYGQREHFLMIFIFPYLLLASARPMKYRWNRSFAFLVGIFAAIGFSIKPFFLLAFAGIELYSIVIAQKKINLFQRIFHPEVIGIIFFSAVYYAGILVFMPQYISMISMGLLVYDIYNSASLLIALNQSIFLAVIVTVGFLYFFKKRILSPYQIILYIAMIAFVAAVFIQHKNWPYHHYPIFFLAILLLTQMSLEIIITKFELPANFIYCFFFFALLYSVILSSYYLTSFNSFLTLSPFASLKTFVTQHAEKKPIYVFSVDPLPAFPLVNLTSTQWSSRFFTLWPLPKIVQHKRMHNSENQKIHAVEKFIINSTITDLQNYQPELIVVNHALHSDNFLPRDFDYIQFFSQDERFISFWKQYDYATTFQPYDVFKRIRP